MKPNLQQWIRVVSATLMATVCLLIAAQAIRAQSPDSQTHPPEVQQLKDRVRQLEQTVEELKGQINAIEEAQNPPSNVATGAPVAATADTTATAEKPKAAQD